MDNFSHLLARGDKRSANRFKSITGPLTSDGSYPDFVWGFSKGEPFLDNNAEIRFCTAGEGDLADFFVTSFGAVLAKENVCNVVKDHGFDVQIVPCILNANYSILNPVHCIDCIDRELSKGEYNRDGSVKTMLDLKLLKSQIMECDIFRIRYWETAGFIVSKRVFDVFCRSISRLAWVLSSLKRVPYLRLPGVARVAALVCRDRQKNTYDKLPGT